MATHTTLTKCAIKTDFFLFSCEFSHFLMTRLRACHQKKIINEMVSWESQSNSQFIQLSRVMFILSKVMQKKEREREFNNNYTWVSEVSVRASSYNLNVIICFIFFTLSLAINPLSHSNSAPISCTNATQSRWQSHQFIIFEFEINNFSTKEIFISLFLSISFDHLTNHRHYHCLSLITSCYRRFWSIQNLSALFFFFFFFSPFLFLHIYFRLY